MPGRVTVTNATGSPTQPAGADVAMCIVGASTSFPLPAGQVTPPYSAMGAAVTDLGQGDAVDALCQAIAITPGNPAPPGVSFYQTPSTTPGSYGTINVSGVLGTCLPAVNAAIAPTGTLDPWMQIVTGGTVGVSGMTAWASLNGGRAKVLVQLGVSDAYNFPANDGFAGQAGFILGPPAAAVAALYTALNNLRTAELAHFLITTGSPAIHLAADTTDNTALTAIPVASSAATAVALYNGLLAHLATHGASTTYHTTADTVLATALAALPVAVNTADVEANLSALTAGYNAHRVLVGSGPVHGSADSTNTCAAFTATPSTLLAGDTFYVHTSPPSWADADLYAAGPPATGAFAAIGASSYSFAIIVVTEPVQISDFPTLSAGLDSMLVYNKRPTLLCRFRDQMQTGETTAQYITAVRAFCAACQDNRITISYGGGWLTDAFSQRIYSRSGLPAVLARAQGNQAYPGVEGEVIAQSPAWAGRGPLEGFSLVDNNGHLVPGAVDEFITGGQDQVGSVGGAMGYCYQRDAATQGTYVSAAPVLYPSSSTVLTLMDSRVSQALQRVLYSVAWTMIQGASVVQNGILDPDLADAMGMRMYNQIGPNSPYAHEFANASSPNLVKVNPSATVIGANMTFSVNVDDELFDFVNGINITLFNVR